MHKINREGTERETRRSRDDVCNGSKSQAELQGSTVTSEGMPHKTTCMMGDQMLNSDDTEKYTKFKCTTKSGHGRLKRTNEITKSARGEAESRGENAK